MHKDRQLNIDKLYEHIRRTHPMKSKHTRFSIFVNIGMLTDNTIRAASQEIGIGANLYLHTVSSMGKMFFMLSILNSVMMYINYCGDYLHTDTD